MYKQF